MDGECDNLKQCYRITIQMSYAEMTETVKRTKKPTGFLFTLSICLILYCSESLNKLDISLVLIKTLE